jgi:hypothetical protein
MIRTPRSKRVQREVIDRHATDSNSHRHTSKKIDIPRASVRLHWPRFAPPMTCGSSHPHYVRRPCSCEPFLFSARPWVRPVFRGLARKIRTYDPRPER